MTEKSTQHQVDPKADRLAQARQKLQEKRERGEATHTRLNPKQKAQQQPNSKKAAINGKCFECQGEDNDAGWMWRIGNCTCTDCSLYPHRPYQNKHGAPMPQSMMLTENWTYGEDTPENE